MMRLILDSATDHAIFTVDRDGMVTTWNPGAERLLGYTDSEIIGEDGRIRCE
jgi:PAS domain S-box-containing protein